MASRVIQLLKNSSGSSLFFAFGADHFVGEENIIDMVRVAGFTVERVNAADDLSAGGARDTANVLLVLCFAISLTFK